MKHLVTLVAIVGLSAFASLSHAAPDGGYTKQDRDARTRELAAQSAPVAKPEQPHKPGPAKDRKEHRK